MMLKVIKELIQDLFSVIVIALVVIISFAILMFLWHLLEVAWTLFPVIMIILILLCGMYMISKLN